MALGVRTDDGLYRFIRGFDGSVAVGHHLFSTWTRGGRAGLAGLAQPGVRGKLTTWQGGQRHDPTISTGDSGYAPVNGLQMYYEVHGGSGRPLVLLHGNLSTIGVDFGGIIPSLAKNRQVIGVEQQAHGHTADIDRPLSVQNWTSDTVALLRHLGIGQADCSATAPGRRWPCSSPSTTRSWSASWCSPRPATGWTGCTLLEGVSEVKPEHLAGTPFEQDYARVAPTPATGRG